MARVDGMLPLEVEQLRAGFRQKHPAGGPVEFDIVFRYRMDSLTGVSVVRKIRTGRTAGGAVENSPV